MPNSNDHNAWFEERLARHLAEQAEKLARAKQEAGERGKAPFDLDALDALYPDTPWGCRQPRDVRARDLEYRYYVVFPDAMTLAEYAAMQWALDAGAAPRLPRDPAERAARANTLLARIPADLGGRTAAALAQARRDLTEALGHLEAILATIPAESEQVPDEAFGTMSARRWSALYPDRFLRTNLVAAIAELRQRLESLDTVRIGGVVVSAREIPSRVEQQLSIGGVWSDRDDYDEVDGLRRALGQAGPLLAAFGEALIRLLEHADVRVRTRAIVALGDAAGHVSSEAVLVVLERAPQLFRGVAPAPGPPVQGEDLEAALIDTLARLARPGDAHTTAFLRDRLARSHSITLLLALVEAAPEWVAANAAAIVPREALGGVLHTLKSRALRRGVVEALSPWPPDEARTLLAKPFWSTLPFSEDERAELMAIVRA